MKSNDAVMTSPDLSLVPGQIPFFIQAVYHLVGRVLLRSMQ